MKEGNIALAALPQANGQTKLRPTLLLRQLPPFGDWLVCGFSTQLRHQASGFDEAIRPSDDDFSSSSLKSASLIRLGFLSTLSSSQLVGVIGSVSTERLERLQQRLGEHLLPKPVP